MKWITKSATWKQNQINRLKKSPFSETLQWKNGWMNVYIYIYLYHYYQYDNRHIGILTPQMSWLSPFVSFKLSLSLFGHYAAAIPLVKSHEFVRSLSLSLFGTFCSSNSSGQNTLVCPFSLSLSSGHSAAAILLVKTHSFVRSSVSSVGAWLSGSPMASLVPAVSNSSPHLVRGFDRGPFT